MKGLLLARHSIEQIGVSAEASRRTFLEGAARLAMEVYREPLTQDSGIWSECASEWGMGRGFKTMVGRHLKEWFDEERADLKETLDTGLATLWERNVIAPLIHLTEECFRSWNWTT